MAEQISRRANNVTSAPFDTPFENHLLRFGQGGLNLKDSLDAMEGWSRLTNIWHENEGEATSRPGQTAIANHSGTCHSIRKLRLPASGASGIVDGGGPGTIPDYLSIVEATLATFDPVIPEADVEQGKAQLTRAAAWAIYNGVPDTNMRLLEKTYGNQVNNLSTDVIVQGTDGSFADVASEHNNGDGTVTILARWISKAPDSNTTDASRWVTPTLALATDGPNPMGPA